VPAFRVELHSHCQGDPVDRYLTHSVFEHVDQAKKVGLDAIAITWHRKIFDNPEAIAYARERGVLLIPGMEAEVNNRHLVVLNLAVGDLPAQPTWNQVRALRLRRPDVLVMAPHPFYPHPSCLGKNMDAHTDCIDIVEWCFIHVKWIPGRVNPNLRAARWAEKHGKTLVACSDSHSLGSIGRNFSTVEADELTTDAIFAGLRAGRVTFERSSLPLAPLAIETTKAMSSQPRHVARWIKHKIRKRRPRIAAEESPAGSQAES
jgi:predicted metal-dependent phosphoesterase TrpH